MEGALEVDVSSVCLRVTTCDLLGSSKTPFLPPPYPLWRIVFLFPYSVSSVFPFGMNPLHFPRTVDESVRVSGPTPSGDVEPAVYRSEISETTRVDGPCDGGTADEVDVTTRRGRGGTLSGFGVVPDGTSYVGPEGRGVGRSTSRVSGRGPS